MKHTVNSMSSNKFFLLTTLPLRNFQDYARSLVSWLDLGFADIAILVNQEEWLAYPQILDEAQGLGFKTISYENTKHQSGFLTPGISTIFETLKGSNSEICGYFNADIYLDRSVFFEKGVSSGDIQSRISAYLLNRYLVLGNRYDYSENLDPTIYRPGFDYFFVSKECLHATNIDLLSNFYIGQVGWDYALPLSFKPSEICIVSDFYAYHLVHPTGSSSSWDEAILQIIKLINPYWYKLRGGNFLKFCSELIGFLIPKSIAESSKVCSSKASFTNRVVKLIRYILSRIGYYLIIRYLIRSIQSVSILERV